ncbi:MAG: cellulase family glycosylhydrolase [Actinobacteria bacterium]|nr:cellulase family glycosylhydrolase [Actinomycetota bacterium]
MPKTARFVLIALVALLATPVAAVQAATRMPIGFFDDSSFRFSPTRDQNLAAVAATGASVIHTTANWAAIAPTRPANAADGGDPAYKLADLDDLVFNAGLHSLRVMINVTGTPKWANGNKTPNRLPTRLGDFTAFTKMLATRYNGRSGHGSVALWSVWNEPNIELFLAPQYSGKKIVGPANYAKLYKAAYAGIKAGNPASQVAIGETSARGRDKPLPGVSGSVAPGTFAKLLAQVKGLKFDAWAHHPYPTSPNLPPLQKVRYPNVTLSTLPTFEKQLNASFHRTVPIWITEYGHETKPGEPHGVTTAKQAAYAKQALTVAKSDPNIQMFIWFVFRDSTGNPWQSGLEVASGAHKPAYNTFSAIAKLTDGQTVAVAANKAPRLKVYLPFLAYYNPAGAQIGVYYTVYDGTKIVARGTPTAILGTDQGVSFTPAFTPVKKHTYSVVVVANEQNGHSETRTTAVTVK